MKNHEIRRIKDKWLEDEKLSEKEIALLFSRIEKLEYALWNNRLEDTTPLIKAKTIKCPECHHLFEIHVIE